MIPKKIRSREKKAKIIRNLDWAFPKNTKKVIFVVKKIQNILVISGSVRTYFYEMDNINYMYIKMVLCQKASKKR